MPDQYDENDELIRAPITLGRLKQIKLRVDRGYADKYQTIVNWEMYQILTLAIAKMEGDDGN